MAGLAGSLAGSLAGRLSGSLAGGGAAPVAPPLDGLASAPVGAYSFGERLFTSYTGPLYRVRRASDNAELDIGYAALTNRDDRAALIAFCTPGGTPTNGLVVTRYDHSGNANHLTQGNVALQGKIYDSVTGAVTIGATGSLGVLHDTAGGNDRYEIASALGLSGATAVSMLAIWTTTFNSASPGGLGAAASGQALEQWQNGSFTQTGVSIGGANRIFTLPDVRNQVNCTIHRLDAGAGIGTSKLMHNAVECGEASSLNPSNTLNLGTTQTRSGDRRLGLDSPITGKMGPQVWWGFDLTAPDLAIANALWSARYV